MQDNTIYQDTMVYTWVGRDGCKWRDLRVWNQDTMVYTWVGRDGCKWRDLRVWTGSGHAHFTQREINPGFWG